MKIISAHPPTFHVALFEDQEKSGASEWFKPPPFSLHWSFAIATKDNLEPGDSINIEVSNDDKQPPSDKHGDILMTLTPEHEAEYVQASYRWIRAVKQAGSKSKPVTVYGSFVQPLNP